MIPFTKFNLFILLCLILSSLMKAQLSGGFESNGSWYIDDNKIQLVNTETSERFRSNNYLKLDYGFNNFTAGVQLEGYLPQALLNYYPKFDNVNVGTAYLEYKNDKINLDITAGHFYEQFGSGLAFRAWEDRQLGIAQPLLGGKITYQPKRVGDATVLYGKQRLGFGVADSDIFGFNGHLSISDILDFEKSTLKLGASLVSRNEKIENIEVKNPTNIYSTRIDLTKGKISFDAEYLYKSKDVVTDINYQLVSGKQFDGNATLVNVGFSQKGLSMNMALRRLENMGFYSERSLRGNTFNVGNINYLPALTKQNDLFLANIYVYQAQPYLKIPNNKSGEIGYQFDFFYTFKKQSTIGGKHGTSIALNLADWYELDATYDVLNNSYQSKYFGKGEKMYRELNVELRKKWSSDYNMIFTYINQFYNKNRVESINNTPNVKTHIFGIDNNLKLAQENSLRLELEHLSTQDDKKSWVSGMVEYAFNPSLSFYVSDLYNYGNDDVEKRIHYYNIGGNFTKGKSRLAVSYGRQRGGLLCVGGVCRYVPESNGLNFNISTSF